MVGAARRRLLRPVRDPGPRAVGGDRDRGQLPRRWRRCARPTARILCHEIAHIEVDEAGAPGFFTHGAKLTLLAGSRRQGDAGYGRGSLRRVRNDVHQVQPAALSITNATEYGLSYRPDEVAALGEVARRRGLGFHMDGARFANAVAFTGADPADADLARRRRRDVVRLRQERRAERRGADLLRSRPRPKRRPRCASAPGICVEGPQARRADPGDARGRPVADQCPRRQCRRSGAGRGGRAGAAGLSGRGQ